MWIVVALTLAGLVMRAILARQSVVADELSTVWMIADHGLGDVIAKVYTDAEITPPLSFAASWLTTRIALTPEWLRAPSVLAGTAVIPLVYLVGKKTVGVRAGQLAAALTTLSPFMLHYSSEARGYALMMAFSLASTLALLNAIEDGRARWWAAYAAASCAAMYSHYTCVFVLAAQLAWVLWTEPRVRRAALLANVAAVAAFLPWLGGLRGDLDSPTTQILSALQPFTAHYVSSSIAHWAIGYPYAAAGEQLRDLPGVPALIALVLALGLGVAALAAAAARRRLPAPGPRVVLVLMLAAAAPVGEALVSAVGSNVLGTRNLASSWAPLALCLAALILAAGPRARIAATVLAVGAFGVGAVKMFEPHFQRLDFRAVAAAIDREAGPRDVVVDAARASPVGVPPPLQLALQRRHTIVPIGAHEVLYDPFRFVAVAPPPAEMTRRAVAEARRRDGRLFLVLIDGTPPVREVLDALPHGTRVRTRSYPGVERLLLVEADVQTASGA